MGGRENARVLCLVLAMVSMTGCAFGTRDADLTYPPRHEGEGVIPEAHAAVAPVAGERSVVLAVSDERPNKARIGNVRNAFGMDTADVVTDEDVDAWVTGALSRELSDKGYVVRAAEDPEGGESLRIDAEIVHVYCDVYLSYDGKVGLGVTFSSPGRPPLRKQYEGKGSVGVNWAATAESYAQSLALALENALSQVMADLADYEGR